MFKSYIWGKQPLWKAFWVFSGLGGLAFLISYDLVTNFVQQYGDADSKFIVRVFLFCVGFVCSLLLAYVVWRCSQNTSSPIWTYAARIFAVLQLGSCAVMLALTVSGFIQDQ